MPKFAEETVVSRGTGHAETAMADQTVMMNLDRGRYYALEGTAQRIWQMLATPVAVGEIVDRLTEEYSVGREECAGDVARFLADLDANGLLARDPA